MLRIVKKLVFLIPLLLFMGATAHAQINPQIQGAGAPSNPCANGGQQYVDTTNHVIYLCPSAGSSWVNIGPGNQQQPVQHGAGAPSPTSCMQGTLYTNDSNGNFYSCNAGTWALASGATGTTINATNNVLPKRSNATTFVDSALTDNGTTVASTEPISTTGSLTAGSGCTPAGATATGGVCMTEAASTGWTPTAGFSYLRADTGHSVKISVNGGAEVSLPTATINSCATTNAIGIFSASTTLGCGNGDFTYATNTLTMGASGLLNLGAGAWNSFIVPKVSNGSIGGAIDGGILFDTSRTAFAMGENGSGNFVIAAAANNSVGVATTCVNQVLTAISGITAPTCTTLTNSFLPSQLTARGPTGIYNFNQAAQSQVVVSATEYYITRSDLDMPAAYTTAIGAGTTMKWRLALTKTAAGTGTFQILLKKGTNGSTADTSIVTQTIGTQTAAADNMEVDIELVWTSTTAAYWSIIPRQSAASGTGFGLVYPAAAAQFTGTISGQTTTTASDKYGVSVIFTTGTPTFVANMVQAQAFGVN